MRAPPSWLHHLPNMITLWLGFQPMNLFILNICYSSVYSTLSPPQCHKTPFVLTPLFCSPNSLPPPWLLFILPGDLVQSVSTWAKSLIIFQASFFPKNPLNYSDYSTILGRDCHFSVFWSTKCVAPMCCSFSKWLSTRSGNGADTILHPQPPWSLGAVTVPRECFLSL